MSEDRVALVGTRKRVPAVLADITRVLEALRKDTLVVTGDQEGTDLHVVRECERLGLICAELHAPWTGRGKPAGPARNEVIARLAVRAVAWPLAPRYPAESRSKSRGTWDCVERFESRAKPVEVRETAWKQEVGEP